MQLCNALYKNIGHVVLVLLLLLLFCSCLMGVVGRPIEAAPLETDALILDMGEYYQPSLSSIIPSANGELANTAVDLSPPALDITDAAVAAAAGAVVRSPAPSFQLQLYSVMPRCLQANAKVWMGQLAFREATQQTRVGYFCAPGAKQTADACSQASVELCLRLQHAAECPTTSQVVCVSMSCLYLCIVLQLCGKT
jgi:hypothetical protein